MSKYTYNVDKSGCIRVPAILSQKNDQDYKLISAEDISWNVTLKDNTIVSTTDDLLDYILRSNQDVIDQVLEASYKIDCPITVCYEGDVFENSPEINVYRKYGYNQERLSYLDLAKSGITVDILNPNGQIRGIIKFDEEGLYLTGVAQSGIHTMRLMKEELMLATFTIVCLKKPLESYSTTIYKESKERPVIPQGGTYDFTTREFEAPDGWSTNILAPVENVWFSTGYILSNSTDITWSSPALYITEAAFDEKYQYRSVGYAVYKTVNKDTYFLDKPGEASFDGVHFVAPDGWYLSAADSVLHAYYVYGEYKIYVSYITYTIRTDTKDQSVEITSTDWSAPIEYIDINSILEMSESRASKVAEEAVDFAENDLKASIFKIDYNLNGRLDLLLSLISNLSEIDTVVNSLSVLYEWKETLIGENEEYEILTDTTFDTLKKEYTGSKYFNKIYYLSQEGKYYKYTASTAVLTTLLSLLLNNVGELGNRTKLLETAVNEITPQSIRLQASAGYLSDVTWTAIEKSEYDNQDSKPKYEADRLPTESYEFGSYWKINNEDKTYYYRCDYPITTGFLNILSDNLSLGVADNDGNKSTIVLRVNDGKSNAQINAGTFTINGDTIAGAIAAKELNINNNTIISSVSNDDLGDKEMVVFGNGTGGRCSFRKNGSGYLAGGKIEWDNTGLSVMGTITALGGQIGYGDNAWNIGTIGDGIPAIYAKDSQNNELALSTEYLQSETNDVRHWILQNDGYALFANGNVYFGKDGTCRIGSEQSNITIDGKGALSIKGADVTISATQKDEIVDGVGAGVLEFVSTNEYKESIAGLVVAPGLVEIIGKLKTEDVVIGNGACFFKGSDKENEDYPTYTTGAGFVANGNISWDSLGNITLKGPVDMQANASSTGSDVILSRLTVKGLVDHADVLNGNVPNVDKSVYGINNKDGLGPINSYTINTQTGMWTGVQFLYVRPSEVLKLITIHLPDPEAYIGRKFVYDIEIPSLIGAALYKATIADNTIIDDNDGYGAYGFTTLVSTGIGGSYDTEVFDSNYPTLLPKHLPTFTSVDDGNKKRNIIRWRPLTKKVDKSYEEMFFRLGLTIVMNDHVVNWSGRSDIDFFQNECYESKETKDGDLTKGTLMLCMTPAALYNIRKGGILHLEAVAKVSEEIGVDLPDISDGDSTVKRFYYWDIRSDDFAIGLDSFYYGRVSSYLQLNSNIMNVMYDEALSHSEFYARTSAQLLYALRLSGNETDWLNKFKYDSDYYPEN